MQTSLQNAKQSKVTCIVNKYSTTVHPLYTGDFHWKELHSFDKTINILILILSSYTRYFRITLQTYKNTKVMKMNEREKRLEKKDSWGYIINIIYEITTSNALLNVPENGESGYTGRQYLLSNPLIFCAYQKNIQTIVLWNY